MKTKFSRMISLLCAAVIATVCLIPTVAAEDENYVNVALDAKATVSTSAEGYGADNAIDGDTSTFWRSTTKGAEYIILTWDTVVEVEYVTAILTNGKHVGKDDCTVSILKDGETTFTKVETIKTSESTNPVTLKFVITEGAQKVKAVKFDMAKTDKDYYQMLEFQAYSKQGVTEDEPEEVKPNLALASKGAEVFVSGVSDEAYPADYANDGVISSASRWRSQGEIQDNPAWIAVKLDKAYRIGTLETYWWDGLSPSASGEKVQISDDGETWIDVSFTRSELTKRSINGVSNVDCLTYTLNEGFETQYVRIYATASTAGYYMARNISCFEFEVYEGEERQDIKTYANGTERFVATTVPADAEGKRLVATYSIIRNGKKITGATEIKRAYSKIILGEIEVTSEDFEIEDPGEYVTGIFITNVRENDRISVRFEFYEDVFIFLGSSVTYGANAGGRSFVELIDEKYDDVTCVKLAVGGTALSVATTPNGTSYVERLVANADNYPVCDHLNVQLSSNDATGGRPLGTVSESKNKEDFDTTTIAGAMEYIIAFAREKWDCEVSFYANPKLINPSNGEVDGRDWYYEDMVEVLLQIKEKWGIRVLDMYNDAEMTNISLEDRAKYMADSIHPNATGYEEWWLPKFEEFLFGEE